MRMPEVGAGLPLIHPIVSKAFTMGTQHASAAIIRVFIVGLIGMYHCGSAW